MLKLIQKHEPQEAPGMEFVSMIHVIAINVEKCDLQRLLQ